MDVDEEREPDTASQAEEESSLIIIDPKLATLPKDWTWINSGEEGFNCVKMVVSSGKILNPKSIQILNNNVTYLVKQKPAKPLHLAHSFKSIEELNDIFKYFDDAPICEGCPEEELQLLQLDSAKIEEGIKKKHCWRSSHCEYIVVPGEKRCPSCSSLLNMFRKKKTKPTKAAKLKKTQVELKNLRIKNQRATTKIMVCFVICFVFLLAPFIF